jgi:Leucine-rich repeat (LRR) protein
MLGGSNIVVIVLACLEYVHGSFWNEIPARCTYDRTKLFTCTNTTFTRSIPLFIDRTYTMTSHHVDIQYCSFELSLRDLLVQIGTTIEHLTLIKNSFSSMAIDTSRIFEGGLFFRLLTSLNIHDEQGQQWLQLNGSYFPQLIRLDLSNNHLTVEHTLVFNRQYYPNLLYLDLSNNQLTTIDRLVGNQLNRLETLILSNNPLKTMGNLVKHFLSLEYLDLSSTSIKQLFSLRLLPHLQTLICQQCREISLLEYDRLLGNCSQLNYRRLKLDLSQTNFHSLNQLNPYMTCVTSLLLNGENRIESITTDDLLHGEHLETIEIRESKTINYVYLNVYDQLRTIDFSRNIYLNQVILRVRSNSVHLQHVNLSSTVLNDFAIDFYNTTLTYLHVDSIDLSHNRLETLEFLSYLIFHSLDVSYNRLKIIDIDLVHYRRGLYELTFMNLMNLSYNDMEYVRINWQNESPHTIDLSNNRLDSIELHGQTTYSLHLVNNINMTLDSTKAQFDLPALTYLDLTAIELQSLETLIYIHNLTNLRTLILDNNQLVNEHRTLNWHVFYPWRTYLTHVSMRNMSLEHIDAGLYLDEYNHLLTIDFNGNDHLLCDCTLQPFLRWLRTPPLPSIDMNEPVQKLLRIDCPISLFDLHCTSGDDDDDDDATYGQRQTLKLSNHGPWLRAIFILFPCALLIYVTLKLVDRRLKHLRSRFYQCVYTNGDIITLNERHTTRKLLDDQFSFEHL